MSQVKYEVGSKLVPEDSSLKSVLNKFSVPILFIGICLIGWYFAKIPPLFLLNQLITRMARNSVLVISLIIPVMAGMGLNFGIVLGAMAAQAAVIAITNMGIKGITGLLVAMVLSTPIAIVLGLLVGLVMNKAKGREMITSMILGFFANGVYQLIFLMFVGSIIPIKNDEILLSGGVGLRNSIDLKGIKYAIDNVAKIKIMGLNIPLSTILVVALFCFIIRFIINTKLGQDFRSIGQNMHIAETSGIDVDRTRVIAVILSTVLAAWGQIIFLQNIGTLNTFGSHQQVGLFAVASLLIGGASVTKATIGQALLGTFLFHTLFIISPMAGQNMLGSPQMGEYFRVFVAYGIIGLSLAMHSWQKKNGS